MSPRLTQLLEEMTPQERAEVETFAAFVIVRRQLQQPQLLKEGQNPCPSSHGCQEHDGTVLGVLIPLGSVGAMRWETQCLRRLLSPPPAPNKGLQPTASSVRSCLDSASGSDCNLALGASTEE